VFDLPPSLLQRLSSDDRAALERFVAGTSAELVRLYRDEVRDHREARGDDAQLFGLKLWKHLWFRLSDLFFDDPVVAIVSQDGSWCALIGPIRVGVYKLGELEGDDISCRFPDNSPTKRSYGSRNAGQWLLFEMADEESPATDPIWEYNQLTIGHFGNPRDGFQKCYVGAYVGVEADEHWAWTRRQPVGDDGELGGDLIVMPRTPYGSDGAAVRPFDEQPVEDIEVEPLHPAEPAEARADLDE
jgi:hypothetical protein